MELLLREMGFVLRALLRQRAFTVMAVLILALGLGASTAMFSVIHGVLLRPLSLPAPERLVDVGWVYQTWRGGLSDRQFRHFAEHQRSLAHVAARTGASFTLGLDGRSERMTAQHVSAGYFTTLGVVPALGRDFRPEDDVAGAAPSLIVTDALWRRALAQDPQAVGRPLRLDGEQYTVIGVLPRGFGDETGAQAYLPIAPVAQSIGQGSNYTVVGRLADGLSLEQAQSDFESLALVLQGRDSQAARSAARIQLLRFDAALTRDARRPLLLFAAAIAAVLLIACANVANLLMVRASLRRRELAVRAALGASAARLRRLVLMESVAIALLGTALGLLVAHAGIDALLALRPDTLPRADEIGLDATAFGFAALLAVACGLLAGWPASLSARGGALIPFLRGSATGSTGEGGQSRIRNALVVGQVAVAMVLCIGAGLLVQTVYALHQVDTGIRTERLLAAQFWSSGTAHDDQDRLAAYADALQARLEAIPGVRSAAVVAMGLPLEQGGNYSASLRPADPDSDFSADLRAVGPGYFDTLGTPLLRGRAIDASDRGDSTRVVVVNAAFVRAFLDGADPVGALLHMDGSAWQIVGVVGDVRSHPASDAPPTLFLPLAQAPHELVRLFEGWFPLHAVVASDLEPAMLVRAVGETFAALDPDVPLGRVQPLAEVFARSIGEPRFQMSLLAVFAAVALSLAVAGIYGVLSFVVGARTRDIGIELALGARPSDVIRKVLRQGLTQASLGAAIGIAAALYLTRFLESVLFGISALSPPVYLAAATVLLLAATAAALVPARRAARIAPQVALRWD